MLSKDIGEYKELVPPIFMNRHRINENHEHVTAVYFGIAKTGVLKLSEEEVTEECKWFTEEELEQSEVPEHTKVYALKALESLRG